jgi:hypothetical protein
LELIEGLSVTESGRDRVTLIVIRKSPCFEGDLLFEDEGPRL